MNIRPANSDLYVIERLRVDPSGKALWFALYTVDPTDIDSSYESACAAADWPVRLVRYPASAGEVIKATFSHD